MKCFGCESPVDEHTSLQYEGKRYCGTCYADRAGPSITKLSEDKKKRIYQYVKEQTEGFVPEPIILYAIEQFCDRLDAGERRFDDEVKDHAVELKRLTSLAVCKEMIRTLESLEHVIVEQKAYVYQKMRELTGHA